MKKDKGSLFFILFAGLMFGQGAMASDLPPTTDSRIKTLLFNENEIYQLKFHYGYQSFIELSADEEIELISLGEAFPWKITPIGKRIFVRPLQINAKTNMVVITNRRTYQFEINSDSYTGRADEELIYSVRFYYPENTRKIPSIPGQASGATTAEGDTTKIGSGKTPAGFADSGRERGDVINYNYSMAGKAKDIVPLKTFDDGIYTYFQFSNNNLVVPSISSVDMYGEERPLNYFIDGDYVVVNTVQMQYALRLGNSLLCIFNHSMM